MMQRRQAWRLGSAGPAFYSSQVFGSVNCAQDRLKISASSFLAFTVNGQWGASMLFAQSDSRKVGTGYPILGQDSLQARPTFGLKPAWSILLWALAIKDLCNSLTDAIDTRAKGSWRIELPTCNCLETWGFFSNNLKIPHPAQDVLRKVEGPASSCGEGDYYMFMQWLKIKSWTQWSLWVTSNSEYSVINCEYLWTLFVKSFLSIQGFLLQFSHV